MGKLTAIFTIILMIAVTFPAMASSAINKDGSTRASNSAAG